jgi:hypothetical protein
MDNNNYCVRVRNNLQNVGVMQGTVHTRLYCLPREKYMKSTTFHKSSAQSLKYQVFTQNYNLKMTLLSTLLHLTNFRNPFLITLVPSVSAAFAIQMAVAIPSILTQSERFYDLSGSLTYLSVITLSLYLPTLRARAAAQLAGNAKPAWPSLLDALKGTGGPNGLNWRQVALSTAVAVWATRCESQPLNAIPHSALMIDLTTNSGNLPLSTYPLRRQGLPL